MEYLVKSHLGGYYISNLNPIDIESYCEQCGDSDTIILSFEEGTLNESLKKYFSGILLSEGDIKYNYELGTPKDEIIDDLLFDYECDENMIDCLFELNIISKDIKTKLLKQISISQKKQFDLVNKVFEKNNIKIKKLKKEFK